MKSFQSPSLKWKGALYMCFLHLADEILKIDILELLYPFKKYY